MTQLIMIKRVVEEPVVEVSEEPAVGFEESMYFRIPQLIERRFDRGIGRWSSSSGHCEATLLRWLVDY